MLSDVFISGKISDSLIQNLTDHQTVEHGLLFEALYFKNRRESFISALKSLSCTIDVTQPKFLEDFQHFIVSREKYLKEFSQWTAVPYKTGWESTFKDWMNNGRKYQPPKKQLNVSNLKPISLLLFDMFHGASSYFRVSLPNILTFVRENAKIKCCSLDTLQDLLVAEGSFKSFRLLELKRQNKPSFTYRKLEPDFVYRQSIAAAYQYIFDLAVNHRYFVERDSIWSEVSEAEVEAENIRATSILHSFKLSSSAEKNPVSDNHLDKETCKPLNIQIAGPQIQVDAAFLLKVFPSNVRLENSIRLLLNNALTNNKEYADARAGEKLSVREFKVLFSGSRIPKVSISTKAQPPHMGSSNPRDYTIIVYNAYNVQTSEWVEYDGDIPGTVFLQKPFCLTADHWSTCSMDPMTLTNVCQHTGVVFNSHEVMHHEPSTPVTNIVRSSLFVLLSPVGSTEYKIFEPDHKVHDGDDVPFDETVVEFACHLAKHSLPFYEGLFKGTSPFTDSFIAHPVSKWEQWIENSTIVRIKVKCSDQTELMKIFENIKKLFAQKFD